jgi:hypothetical protein
MEWQSCRAYLNDLVAIWLWYSSISLGSTQHAARSRKTAGRGARDSDRGGSGEVEAVAILSVRGAPHDKQCQTRVPGGSTRNTTRRSHHLFFLLLLKIRLILVRTMERTESFGHYTHG